MNYKKNIALNLRDAVNDPPEKDGNYVVLRVWLRDKRVYSVDNIRYTVAGGWNTCYLADGTLHDSSRLAYEEDTATILTLWSEMPNLKEYT